MNNTITTIKIAKIMTIIMGMRMKVILMTLTKMSKSKRRKKLELLDVNLIAVYDFKSIFWRF